MILNNYPFDKGEKAMRIDFRMIIFNIKLIFNLISSINLILILMVIINIKLIFNIINTMFF